MKLQPGGVKRAIENSEKHRRHPFTLAEHINNTAGKYHSAMTREPHLNAAPVTVSPSPSVHPGAGRYAPSPSGDLHLGNLRTALLAWMLARQGNLRFVMRIEDLDRVKEGAAQQQLADLASLGLDWEQPVLYQSTRRNAYQREFERLQAAGMVYECYCTRREIQQAATAPHGAPGAYPGTCRELSDQQRAERRAHRAPAYRLRAGVSEYTVHDMFRGDYTAAVDDVVLVRNDGTFAYNLAVVVDDYFQGVTQVVRGDDLLSSAPRQAYVAHLLGYPPVTYAHVPLALNEEGKRLAKRDGAVTLPQLRQAGFTETDVLSWIAASIPVADPKKTGGAQVFENAMHILRFFDPQRMSLEPWTVQDPLKIS